MYLEAVRVDICIATYKRVVWLNRLLATLVSQELGEHIQIRVIVIDNDPEKSAQNMVVEFFSTQVTPYIYDSQPEKNIALTRNKALDYVDADYVAFIDDDEWAATDWLMQLLNACQKYDADVVFGPAIPQFPENTPDWILNSDFFYRTKKSGTFLSHGATNNTLIRNPGKLSSFLRFNPSYGLTGGEDTELFYRLYIAGKILVWCNEATVYEAVSNERLTVRWLTKRALRGGQVYARVFYKNQPLLKVIIHALRTSTYLFIACIMLPFSVLLGKGYWVWVLRKVMANYGKITMFFTDKCYQEYK